MNDLILINLASNSSLDEVADKIYETGLDIGQQIAKGRSSPFHVFVASRAHMSELADPQIVLRDCMFKQVDDYMPMASHQVWLASWPTFLRLSVLKHHLSEIRQSASISLLRNKRLVDQFYWTFWLQRLNIQHLDCLFEGRP